ncbi:GH25 family lysozyme [Butyrivibrio sp. AE3006]|uniref:GH25 family lysozyme n=1 Tax=Butyrivibrio sp. AE3006 TaxID=1280673 RepID=UPI0018C9DBBD|nr:GH25 family lysozyme [Butyrivibrio sp. AE3006]
MKKNDHQNSKMVRKTKDIISIIFLSLVSLLALTFCIGLLLSNADLRRRIEAKTSELDAIENEGYYTTARAEQMVESAVAETQSETLESVRNTFKEELGSKGSLSAIRELFPDDLIVASNGEYRFYPIDENMDRHMFKAEDFRESSNGKLDYIGPDESVQPKFGIMVSRYNGEINFENVKSAGVDFVMVRAGLRGSSEDASLVEDDFFRQDINGALAAGLQVGVYFDSSAINTMEAEEEAEFVLSLIAPYEVTYPIAIMIEASDSPDSRTINLETDDYSKIIDAYCSKIQDAGYKPMVYGNILSYVEYIDLGIQQKYPVWFSFSGDRPYYPYHFDMWEYTRNGYVYGINGGANFIMCLADYSNSEETDD